jgi:large conductance mechanosensitive channel
MKGFLEFIQEQGVVGIAIAFVLGASVTKLVSAFITDFVNPILSVILGLAGGIAGAKVTIGPLVFAYGHFITVLIDFLIVAFIIYGSYKIFKLEKLTKKKEGAK